MNTERLGERIKGLREKRGMTQQNIASFLDVDQSLISLIERGKRVISTDMLDELAALFGMSSRELVESGATDATEDTQFSIAFRANDLGAEDFKAISAINRIALNSQEMARLLRKGKMNG